ncbi:hypothetical protein [Novosphingobium sediminicola]|uniref:Chorismate-pyruvate lyase n=1 Tax=Novosphingobium sediminicola TaxID=563162 RepID=A0A7W6G631_9SPHN|nr:hypothetical protein [Novosphingobium sediminicola]MBB3953547.1 chorismate-pyruvate lyase [Novosphingobium sediminicola]
MLLALLLAHAGSLSAFEATLAAQDSATAALGQWCEARHLADPATIKAAQVKGEDTMPPPDLDETLKLSEDQEPAYRHVRLSCGGKVLSEAHNWYARQRLTPAMNQTLDTTDTPFGKVAGPLGFTRERLGAVRGAAPGCPRDTVLSHRALLRLPDGSPLALVVECYTPAVIGK